ncbi:MAG: hypothetical protein M3T96_00880, partial [Acidobacteriota bacterium]|nr:hypothetical protein [Acidobacteriota bacterium]
ARRAFCLVGASSALRESLKMNRSPAEQTVLKKHLEKARFTLQTAEVEQAQNAGSAMTLDEAAEYALQTE